MTDKTTPTPAWCEEVAPEGSWRSLFKYGDPAGFKHPNRGLTALVKETFGLSDEDLAKPSTLMEPMDIQVPSRLAPQHRKAFAAIVGEDNLRLDTFHRVRASYGAAMIDALRLRHKVIENLPDAVLAPRTREEIIAIVQYCDKHRIPLYVYGGGSSVTRGMEAVKNGICLDLSTHFNQVIAFNEIDQTITVQPGIWGPALEDALNHAPEKLGGHDRYTCGHFPQSFEHSSVGGWVVTRGAGQNSTYYGKIEDIVISQEMVTPRGVIQTAPQPRAATGPDFDQVLMGSEGTFGVLTAVTLRVFRWRPENTRRFSYLFKTWQDALAAYREIMQGEFGFPSVFRLSDPEETDVAMRTYHIHGTPADSLLRALGYQPMQRCLLLGTADGEAGFTRHVASRVSAICRRHHAFVLTPFRVTQAWEKSRFTDPFLREDLMDFGVLIDTLECAVTWSQLEQVHESVRRVVKARPHTICMTHLSHAYPQGGNLYWIFIAKMTEIEEYLQLQYAILDAILKSGAAMSHHHGVGKQTAPWLEEQIGKPCMDVIRVLKHHFDPRNVMNPGGTLGLDMSPEQAARRWGKKPSPARDAASPNRALSKAGLEQKLQQRKRKYE